MQSNGAVPTGLVAIFSAFPGLPPRAFTFRPFGAGSLVAFPLGLAGSRALTSRFFRQLQFS